MYSKWLSTMEGNLGKDPEVGSTKTGVKVAKFSLALNQKDGDDKSTEWVNVSTFDKLAEIAQQYLRKGSKVVIVGGRTRINRYTGKQDNLPKFSIEVTASDIIFMDRKDASGSPAPAPPAEQSSGGSVSDDDIPF